MTSAGSKRSLESFVIVALLASVLSNPLSAQRGSSGDQSMGDLPTIEEKTDGMASLEGFLPLYWDAGLGQLWMEIPELDEEMIHFAGFGAGLGSNDIGLDRGALRGSRIVKFERVGRKILMVQPNYRFRANSDNPSETQAVRDAFARSILWSFTPAAETGGRVLVDLTDFLIRDATNAGQRMSPGTYQLDNSRSSVYMDMTNSFPTNTELEVELTFVQQSGGGGGRGGRGGGGFEGVGSVASTGEAASIRVHHSFVQLPDDDYEPRMFDPRSGYGSSSYQDYAVPLDEPMTQRFIRRHRLQKQDPSAAVSDPVEPIIYYLDPGAPEPIRSALLDGARWWNQAFEAAGYRDAFQVTLRPDSISSLDARYNVINWVHRSTRGWSTGGSVSDPRTGEIIKGVVTLGSLRVRQDYMIAEGLLSPYTAGDEETPEIAEWALARIRQLSAHEVGHTIGLGHNYYNSTAGRISVMDYPHPLVTLNGDGSLDHSQVYDVGIGDWDKAAVTFGYQDFVGGGDDEAALIKVLEDAWDNDVRYMSNQDVQTTPQADQWANGTDMADELDRMMDVRSVAMSRFGEAAIKNGMPMATIEEVLVPLYLHHRYQVESTASVMGGVGYIYAARGDGLRPVWHIASEYQNRALDALMRTLSSSELALPTSILEAIPPRPPGYGRTRELFPRYTGSAFDALTPAFVAASHTVNNILTADRAARLVEQKMLDPSMPGLNDVLQRLFQAAFEGEANNSYETEIRNTVAGVVIERVKSLAETAPMMQVRAQSTLALRTLAGRLAEMEPSGASVLLQLDIRRFLGRPYDSGQMPSSVSAPPGAPIGQPAMDWLGLLEPWCTWIDGEWR